MPLTFSTPLSDSLKKELDQLYAALDDVLEQLSPRCDACGKCCHFTQYDHQLWLTMSELQYLVETNGTPESSAEDSCPYMKDNRCTAREGRALGCRIFHCHMDQLTMEDLHTEFLRRLQQLLSAHHANDDYCEFMHALKELRGK